MNPPPKSVIAFVVILAVPVWVLTVYILYILASPTVAVVAIVAPLLGAVVGGLIDYRRKRLEVR